jgi:hypothetical protein
LFPRRRTVSIAALLVLSLAACSGGDGAEKASVTDPQDCEPKAYSGSKLKTLPPKLPFDDWGTIIKVTERAGFVGAEVISELTIVELYPEISRAVRDGGYETVSGENEGFEAELFFQKGPNTGTFLLREGPCKEQVTLKLIYGAAKG